MKQSFRGSFIKIYFWKALSVILNLASVFIVVPKITSNPTIYGIYMLCVSTRIFFSYADIGFIKAGYKYAAEYYSTGDIKNEANVIGFVNFLLALFLLVPFLLFFIASFQPSILIPDISSEKESLIASSLLLIQALFSFNIILEKFSEIVYGIRLENHIINQITLVAYLLKIISVFYFFRTDHYDIVGYFLFGNIMQSIAFLAIFYYAIKNFHYTLSSILKSFRFSKSLFNKTKGIAFAAFFGTLMWMLYNELDSIVITKFFGASQFAFFAIGLTLTKFIRSIYSVIFGPFSARFNHFIGQKQYEQLKQYFIKSLTTIFPVTFLFILTVIMLRVPIVTSWVGRDYNRSIPIILFLGLGMIFNPIKNLSSALVISFEKTNILYTINIVLVIFYWSLVYLLKKQGVSGFAISKFLSFALANVLFIIFILKLLNLNYIDLITKIFKPIIIPSVLIISISKLFILNFEFTKNSLSFFFVLVAGGLIYSVSFIALYFTSKQIKKEVKSTYELITQKRKNSQNE